MKRRLFACAALGAYCLVSLNTQLHATTLDEVVARLNALEASNKRLEHENAEFRRRLGMATATKTVPGKDVTTEISREVARQMAARHEQEFATNALNQPPAPGQPLIRLSDNNSVSKAFLEKDKSSKLNFKTPNGEILLYGNLDVSVDGVTKGINGKRDESGRPPIGNVGWMPEIATNKSYVGVRGFQNIPTTDLKFVYQLETQIDLSDSSGVSESNSQQSNVVKGGLTSRNSYIGISDPTWGIIKLGKTDTPYYMSTARMNPFQGELGDYSVIMGNTGGDNRVEFGTRLDHAIWYESPHYHGFQFSFLFSPGQNRGYQNDNIAAGESDCTGGNIPGSGGVGGIQPNSCSDGSFGDALSASLVYDKGPIYAVLAYERHFAVNRSSDIGQLGGGGVGIYANAPEFLIQADTADEDAAKAAVQYRFPTRTTIEGIVEHMSRYVPSYLAFQNERQRWGTWFAAEQQIGKTNTVAIGWAHAFRTPGDPGQHNDSYYPAPFSTEGDVTGGPHVDNTANMVTADFKHILMPGLTWYTDIAATLNGKYAHYDLGAGGHGVTTDCHDGSGADGGVGSNPHCWTGGQLVGVSSGLHYNF